MSARQDSIQSAIGRIDSVLEEISGDIEHLPDQASTQLTDSLEKLVTEFSDKLTKTVTDLASALKNLSETAVSGLEEMAAEDRRSITDYDYLAELIASARTEEALDLLHRLAPDTRSPNVVRSVLAARAAEPPHRFTP